MTSRTTFLEPTTTHPRRMTSLIRVGDVGTDLDGDDIQKLRLAAWPNRHFAVDSTATSSWSLCNPGLLPDGVDPLRWAEERERGKQFKDPMSQSGV